MPDNNNKNNSEIISENFLRQICFTPTNHFSLSEKIGQRPLQSSSFLAHGDWRVRFHKANAHPRPEAGSMIKKQNKTISSFVWFLDLKSLLQNGGFNTHTFLNAEF